MNIKNKINNKGAKMKYLILSLMVFSSFQAFSQACPNNKCPVPDYTTKDCNIKNYKYFVSSKTETLKLIKEKKRGCYLQGAINYIGLI